MFNFSMLGTWFTDGRHYSGDANVDQSQLWLEKVPK